MFQENGSNSAEDDSDGAVSSKRMSYGLIVVEGLAVGVLTGLVGVGVASSLSPRWSCWARCP